MKKNKLRFSELLSISFRTYRARPQRVLLTIMGMSVGIATVLMLTSLGYGLQYILIGKLITTEDSLITMDVSLPPESNILIKPQMLDIFKTYKNVGEISAVAEFPGEISIGDNLGLLVDVQIVQENYFRLAGTIPDIGKYSPLDIGGIITTSQALVPLGFAASEKIIGQEIELKVFYQDDENYTFEEIGSNFPMSINGIITDDSLQPKVLVDSKALSSPPPFFTKVLVKALDVEVVEQLRDDLLEEGFNVSARIDLVNEARKITNIITIILAVFGITALVVSSIGMFNTMLVGFLERIYEVGILKSIGATDQDVRNLFLVEASMMGFAGGLGGIVLGIVVGKVANTFISILAVRYGGGEINLFLIPWWFVFLITLFSILIGFISGWWPARRAARLSPKEAFSKR